MSDYDVWYDTPDDTPPFGDDGWERLDVVITDYDDVH